MGMARWAYLAHVCCLRPLFLPSHIPPLMCTSCSSSHSHSSFSPCSFVPCSFVFAAPLRIHLFVHNKISGWASWAGLTLHMHVICILSSSSLPSLPHAHPVACPYMHVFTFVFWLMLVCIVLIYVCCALSICTK